MRDNRRVPSTSLHDDDAVTSDGVPGTEADRTARAARRPEPDAVCAAAADLARAAAEELADTGTVGDHLGVVSEGERLVVHSFECLSRGYRGWRWAVSVARAPRSRTATVCEVVLLPASEALLPPEWVPWSQRLAPGDLGAGDELPYRADDPFLDPGWTATGDEEEDRVAFVELGLGRARVLAREGRDAAAERWYRGSHGPTADVAVHAAAPCSSCGYLVHLAGSMRQMFGVCANEWSPSDGQVVSLDHGCGAHSETDAQVPEPEPLPEPILDEHGIEPVALPPRDTPEPIAEAIAEVAEPGALEVTEGTLGAADPAATVTPDEDGDLAEPDPEAPAHDVPDTEAPAHEEGDPEAPAHEAEAGDPAVAAAVPPEEPEPQP
jgi:hypothetical protein